MVDLRALCMVFSCGEKGLLSPGTRQVMTVSVDFQESAADGD